MRPASDRAAGPGSGRTGRRRAAAPSGTGSSTSSIRSHSTQRSTSGRTPSSSARCISYQRATRPGRHAGVEQLVGPLQQRVDRLGGVALLERAVGELREVPGGRRRSRGSRAGCSQAWPTLTWVTTSNVRPRARSDVQLRERLEAAADPGRRPADALGDRLELAAARRDQRQDPVGLAVVEARQDDRIGRRIGAGSARSNGSTYARRTVDAAAADRDRRTRRSNAALRPRSIRSRHRVVPRRQTPVRIASTEAGVVPVPAAVRATRPCPRRLTHDSFAAQQATRGLACLPESRYPAPR